MTDTTHPHQECLDLFARLSEYLDNELDGSLCRTIEAHLAQCRACRVCLATLERTVALCRASGSHPVPEGFSKQLRALINDLQKP